MRFCLKRLRYAEMVVPLLLNIVLRSNRLDEVDINGPVKLGKESIDDVNRELILKLQAAKEGSTEEPADSAPPPPLVLKKDLPPIVLRRDPPPLKLRSLPCDLGASSSC